MGKVIFNTSISLDGYSAGPNAGTENPMGDGGDALFAWYNMGDIPYSMEGDVPPSMLSRQSIDHLREYVSSIGAVITGRKTFDITDGWHGKPPGGIPFIVLTHNPPREWQYEGSPYTFVTGGIEEAVRKAKEAAGSRDVAVGTASTARQCLQAGLLDEMWLDVAPVILGGGESPFEEVGPLQLEPTQVIQAPGVTHMGYRVVR